MIERRKQIIGGRIAFCCALWLASGNHHANLAQAAVVADCRLVMDGSSDPPGDRAFARRIVSR